MTVALVLILLEVVLVLAFWGGWVWIGGWPGGVILLAGVSLLLALPWVGDLQIDYDTTTNETDLRLSWWGRLTLQTKPLRELRGRVLGIPWRRKLGAKERKARHKERERRAERGRKLLRWATGNFDPVVRALLAALQAAHELLWESRELTVYVQAPTQIEAADRIITGLVGARIVGPLDLRSAGKGERRVRVHYQIGLLRATLTLLYAFLQGRPRALAALRKSATKQAEKEKL